MLKYPWTEIINNKEALKKMAKERTHILKIRKRQLEFHIMKEGLEKITLDYIAGK